MAETAPRLLAPRKHFPVFRDESGVLDPTIHMIHVED
jgi:hypothetical protein